MVDNPNVAADLGYGKGFDVVSRDLDGAGPRDARWTRPGPSPTAGVRFLKAARPERPFLLWLHYVNPHAPYTPPPPYDTAVPATEDAERGPRLPVVSVVPRRDHQQWASPGPGPPAATTSAQYDGEIATVDRAGRPGRRRPPSVGGPRPRRLVVLTSDHGESLGEHDYYFDHGEDLFDPSPADPPDRGGPGARARGDGAGVLASTLDLVPTILDAVKVSYPPDLGRAEPAPGGGGPGGAGRDRGSSARTTAT